MNSIVNVTLKILLGLVFTILVMPLGLIVMPFYFLYQLGDCLKEDISEYLK